MNAITLRVTIRAATAHHGRRFTVENLVSRERRTVPFDHSGVDSMVLDAARRSGLAEGATLLLSGGEPVKGVYFVTAIYPH